MIDPARSVGAGIQLNDYAVGPREMQGPSFGEFLSQALGDVNRLQQEAGQKVQSFATGGNIDIHEVMIAIEQASTAMALTTQVRNKLVDAYQELMHTQI